MGQRGAGGADKVAGPKKPRDDLGSIQKVNYYAQDDD
jgi:hypothetical protein